MLQVRKMRVSETMLPSMGALRPAVGVTQLRQATYREHAIQSNFSP